MVTSANQPRSPVEAEEHSDWSLALESSWRNVMHNWNGSRRYDGSRNKRTQGFTERWGTGKDSDQETTLPCWEYEKDSIANIVATHYPQIPQPSSSALTLVQFRPAWTEQLALAVLNVPFAVVNSHYAVTETTGPLPYLVDLQGNGGVSDSPFTEGDTKPHPAVAARGKFDTENGILQYLQEKCKVDFDAGLSDADKQTSQLLLTLIQTKLVPSLRILRYQDWKAWEQVYRPQSVLASRGGAGASRFTVTSWQVWCERSQERAKLSWEQRRITTDQAIQQARTAYQLLENQLASHKKHFLLESSSADGKPSLVDFVLWGHLANALTDVHLIVILAEFSNLCHYAQRLWDKYFCLSSKDAPEWKEWNFDENSRNAFCQLPMLTSARKSEDRADFQTAVDLMEQLSLKNHFLLESLVIAKEVRSAQDKYLPQRPYPPFYTWYRWRMGDDIWVNHGRKKELDSEKASSADTDAKLKREYRKNDELWVMSVVTVTAMSFIFFSFPGSQE